MKRSIAELWIFISFLARAQTFQLPLASSFTRLSASSARSKLNAMAAPTETAAPSWSELKERAGSTVVGQALNQDAELRKKGGGAAHRENTLRTFDSPEQTPQITLYRDHAGWCPYCQKTMLLVEEKRVPMQISLVPMRSYGDKPQSFMRKIPGGLLPAIEVNGQVITESAVIMELLDKWHTKEDGYKPMLPEENDADGWAKFDALSRLERELFSWWCTLVFRPEGPRSGGGNAISKLLGGGGSSEMSVAMQGFMDCLKKVDKALLSTKGPWFFDEYDYPTMIDFVYVSHVERMLASVAYWKGLNLRDPKWNLKGLNAWLDAFEKREPYLAFKSDYYTHVMDIPPQYGPGYDGGFEEDRKKFSRMILGRDGSWQLPLTHDDPLQPLYRGPPLPLAVLEAVGLSAAADETYENCDEKTMEMACRLMAAWKLSGNGDKVSEFAARGGPDGAKNPRKGFGAQLADPYANPDSGIAPFVDATLRVVCDALLDDVSPPPENYQSLLQSAVPADKIDGVCSSLAYLRDRVGVPRDLPLASARYLRAYLNWAIDVLSSY